MKKACAFILSLILVFSLSACGGGSASSISSTTSQASMENKTAASGNISILMTNDWNEGDLGKEMEKAIQGFEAAYPGSKVTIQTASQQDIKETFQTAALAGGGADLAVMDNSGHAIDLAAMNLLLPLSKFTSPDKLDSTFQPGPLASGKFRGEYYSIPWYMDNCGILYNKDTLLKLGLQAPQTWADLKNCVKVCKAHGYGGIITYLSAYAFYSFFYQNECPVFDTSGTTPKVVVDDESGKEAWNYICDLIKIGGFEDSFKEATTWDKVYESLANGKATFLLGGNWCYSGVLSDNPKAHIGVIPMVKGKTQATILGGWTWNINKNTKNPELCWDFANYMATSNQGMELLKFDKKIPCLRNGVDYSTYCDGNKDLMVFCSEFPYTKARPAIINEKDVDKIITDNILSVVYGQADASTSLKNLAAQLRDNVKKNYG